MASFVTEVLTATGTLGDKEDFPGKVSKIRKKLHDLKSCLQTHIESRYTNFATNVSDASSITSQMEDLDSEIESINNNINNHVKASLSESNKELLALTKEIETLKLTSLVVAKIKSCYEAIEEGNELVREKQWLEAAKTYSKSLEFIRSCSTGLTCEEKVEVLPALKVEMVRQQQKLMAVLGAQWSQRVTFSSTEGEGWELKLGVEGSLVQALHFSHLLQDRLAKFSKELRRCVLEPLLTTSCSLTMSSGSLKVGRLGQDTTSSPPLTVFTQLREVFSFISINMETGLGNEGSQEEDGEAFTFMALLSPHLSTWLCDKLIRCVLAPAVPSTPSDLSGYEEVINGVEELHQYLVSTGVLTSKETSILKYANNVDTIFASKICETLLCEGRELMKLSLYSSEVVCPVSLATLSLGEERREPQPLPIPPNFPLPEQSFMFPKCKISSSARKVLELAERALEQAKEAKALTAVRLFHTVRQLFSLWCAVTPTYHSGALSKQPEVAALAHNSAMYIAHRLVSLGFSHTAGLVDKVGQTTMVDLVPKVREVGCSMLLASLRLQRDHLKSVLQSAGFHTLARDHRLASGGEQGIRGVVSHLESLKSVWSDSLPSKVYLRCMGTLLNTVLEELITIITSMEDISSDSASQLVSLFSQLQRASPPLFRLEGDKPEDGANTVSQKLVKRWPRFRELMAVLGASLVEIEDRWGGGSGPLAQELQPDMVKGLVRALFQNTERRAALLAKIK